MTNTTMVMHPGTVFLITSYSSSALDVQHQGICSRKAAPRETMATFLPLGYWASSLYGSCGETALGRRVFKHFGSRFTSKPLARTSRNQTSVDLRYSNQSVMISLSSVVHGTPALSFSTLRGVLILTVWSALLSKGSLMQGTCQPCVRQRRNSTCGPHKRRVPIFSMRSHPFLHDELAGILSRSPTLVF
jgi:hypothetical protein